MDLMRGWERDSDQMRSIYHSHRGKVENTNKQRDDRYHFKRIPAYGTKAQTALLAQEEFGKIMLALADHRATQPPPRGRPTQHT